MLADEIDDDQGQADDDDEYDDNLAPKDDMKERASILEKTPQSSKVIKEPLLDKPRKKTKLDFFSI